MKKLLTTLMVVLTAATVFAAGEPAADKEKKLSPAEVGQAIQASVGALVPMMAKMTEVIIDAELKIGEKPETARSVAVFKKNLYDALVRQGFTEKQAFEIMLTTPLPTAAPGMK